jgi:dipeptidyl aminopeptidase/acylaminoacyl peptidase
VVGGVLVGVVRADGSVVRVTDLLRLRTVSTIQVSRDGLRAVVTVSSIDPEEWRGDEVENLPRSTLWLVSLGSDPGAPRQLSGPGASDSEPIISPDGRRVAFIRTPLRSAADRSTARVEDAGNIWVMPLDGGEAQQVTQFELGASDAAWSPDGRLLAVVSPVPINQLEGLPDWPLERPGRRWNDEPFTGTGAAAPPPARVGPEGDAASQRAWLAQNASRGDPIVINRLDFQDASALRSSMRFEQIFIVDPENPAAPPTRITSAAAPHRHPQFVEGGSRIVASTVRPTTEHIDRAIHRELWSISVRGRDERPLLAMDGWTFEQPRVSTDGSLVGFVGRQMDAPAVRPWLLGLVPATLGQDRSARADPVWLTATLDRSVERWCWWAGLGEASSSGMIFTAASEGGFPLYVISSGLPSPVPLVEVDAGQPVGVHAFGAGAGSILYARTTPARPCVLIRRDAQGDREVLDLNPWTASRTLSAPLMRWVERPQDARDQRARVQLFAMPPSALKPQRRYPAIVAIHGGPARMWGPGELSMWHEFQWLCGRGFGVIYCNPRGSTGYGEEFVRANRQDWGPGPAGDVLAAVDAALAFDWVDPENLVITGGSYGGYLTAFIITRDDRFKAAHAERGVYDLSTFFGEGRMWRLILWAFGGTPFDPRLQPIIERNSVMRSLARVRTPLLISHGGRDLTTGVSQSEMLYRALRVLGKAVEYVRYPTADHDLPRRGPPRLRIDRLLRIAEFFERFVSRPS